jgi:hypothetical protein
MTLIRPLPVVLEITLGSWKKKQPSSTLTNNRLDRIQDNEKKKELKYRAVDLVDSKLWEASSVASIGIYKL